MKGISAILSGIWILYTAEIQAQQTNFLLLEKIQEPVENAFTILKPTGWLVEGGIVRWDPLTSGGAANAIEAKIDFTLKSDASGNVLIHWLPDIYYVDLSGSHVSGMFREGSTYNGMPVLHKMDAASFLNGYLAPYLHPNAQQMTPISSRKLPDVEQLCYDTDRMKQMGCTYSVAVSEYTYTENGTRFKERAFCIIQDMGPYTAGMWKNRNTVVIRAPEGSFERWEPVFHEIGQSVELIPEWIISELKGQTQRGNTLIQTMQDISRISEEIQRGHAETNAKINRQAYLHLTDQEDFVNPYTNLVESGSNQWDHRWVDNLGNVIYTDREDFDPNYDLELQMDGFRRSKIKQD